MPENQESRHAKMNVFKIMFVIWFEEEQGLGISVLGRQQVEMSMPGGTISKRIRNAGMITYLITILA